MTGREEDGGVGERGARMGMWLFLGTELLFFGGLFLLYAVFRLRYPDGFHAGAARENLGLGTFNTMILLTSSLGMALALSAARRGRRRMAALSQAGAVLLGAAFLAVKAFEWGDKIGAGLAPGSAVLAALGKGQTLFFGLYFTMTGIHALHVAIGVGLIGFTLGLTLRGGIGEGKTALLENTALFWHLVDAVWVFLFPLFYLVT